MALTKTKPIQNLLKKYAKDIAKKQSAPVITGLIMSGILGTLVSIPLYAWAAKKEIQASKKGRYEAMRKDLENPANFVVPTKEKEETRAKIIAAAKDEFAEYGFEKSSLRLDIL